MRLEGTEGSAMHRSLTIFILLLLIVMVVGCGSTPEQKKAAELFSQSEHLYNKKEFDRSKELLEVYVKAYPNGEHIQKVNSLLQSIDRDIAVGKARKNLGLTANDKLNLPIVDKLEGSALKSVAVYVNDSSRDKMILSIDELDKSRGNKHQMIIFSNNKQFNIINRREMAESIVGVYVTTTRQLQVVDSEGNVLETVML